MKQRIEKMIGAEITQEEFTQAKTNAEDKLKWIISREGDANGERRQPYYLEQLIAEAIKQERLTAYLFEHAKMTTNNREKAFVTNN